MKTIFSALNTQYVRYLLYWTGVGVMVAGLWMLEN